MMDLLNLVFIVGGMATAFVAKRSRLAGGIVGLVSAAGILVIGLSAYVEGEGMAIRGVIEIPQWLFLLLVACWFLADGGLLVSALLERKRLRRREEIARSQVSAEAPPVELCQKLLSQAPPEQLPISRTAQSILGGAVYPEVVQALCCEDNLELGDAILRYRLAVDMLSEVIAVIRRQPGAGGATLEEVATTAVSMPGVQVGIEASFTRAKMMKNDLLVAYDGTVVEGMEHLRRLAATSDPAKFFPVHTLRYDPLAREWMVLMREMVGGQIDTTARPPANYIAQFGLVLGVLTLLLPLLFHRSIMLAPLAFFGILLGPMGALSSLLGLYHAKKFGGSGRRLAWAALVLCVLATFVSLLVRT